jgi:putative transposase
MRFRFIEDRRADYPVTIMCEVLAVSPAGYYAWRSRPESRRSATNRELVDDINGSIGTQADATAAGVSMPS